MIKNLVDNAEAVSIKELNGEKSVVYEEKLQMMTWEKLLVNKEE